MTRSCALFVCNDGYLQQALFAAWQLRRMLDLAGSAGQDVDIIIASADDIAAPVQAAGHVYLPMEVDDFITTLPANERLKHYTYWRLPAIDAAAHTYDRILYLDTDVLSVSPQVVDLMSVDLGGAPIAAIRDVHQRHRPNRAPYEFVELGLDTAPYFNAGVLLIDGVDWRRENRFQHITDQAKTNGHALFCHDQSLLNLVFYRTWAELSPVWNWQYSYRIDMLTGYAGAHLIHIAGATKLWDVPNGRLPKTYLNIYAHWCRTQGMPVPAPGPLVQKTLSKNLLKNWWYLNSTIKDLDRFAHDLDVLAPDPKV